MGDSRYHVRLADEGSGEELGLMLTEGPQLGFTRRLINPYAAKMGQGSSQDSDLTEWSVVSLRDWRGGRGQEELEEGTAFYDAWNLETRIENQLTLGPLPIQPSGTYPKYEPGSAYWYAVGYPPAVQNVAYHPLFAARLRIGFACAQRFYVPWVTSDAAKHIKSVDVLVQKRSGATADLEVLLYSDSGGLPGAQLASKAVAAGSIGTDYTWVNFEFSSAYQVTPNTHYWIVVSSSDSVGYNWRLAEWNNVYRQGYAAFYVSGTGWYTIGEKTDDFTFRVRFEKISRAMSFTCPAGGITCSSVQLYVGKIGHPGTYTVTLCQDSGGNPGTVLKTKTFDGDADVSEALGWLQVEWDSGQALTGDAVYHVVVTPPATEVLAGALLRWGGNYSGGYADGASSKKTGSGSWGSETEDLYFRVNTELLDGDVIGFARYGDDWFCAAGDTVYKWDEANMEWDVSDAQADETLTALETWGGYLWAARGANVLRRYDGEGWADVSATYAKLLKAGGGYLHRTNGAAGHEHEVYYTADGSTWSSAITVGAGDYDVTAMEWYRDMLVCATPVRLWGVTVDLAYPLISWPTQEDASNGVGMLMWSRTNCLYIPLVFGLYRWNGDTMVAVGPEQGMGLPAARAGRISMLVGTCNWLYAAVDAGTSGYSSILAYNGMGGWHELQRAERTGQQVGAIGFEAIHSPNRLWFGMSEETRYLQLPDYSDNPYQWTGYEFNGSGELETSWMGVELLEIVKDLHEVVVRGEDFDTGQTVDVYYEVDRSGAWTHLGQVVSGPRKSLLFGSSMFAAKTVGTGSTRTTIELESGSVTTDMAAGDWVKINGEVRQVAGITDSDTFTLETALDEAPVDDDTVYASRPAGREFRLKLVLSTNDKTATPKIKAVFVRYQNNVLDRFVYQMSVRVEDGMSDLAGNPYPHTAADLRVALDGWAKRRTPFVLCDPDGVGHVVKVTGVGEGGYKREEGAVGEVRYGSVYSMNLVEVA